jgi:hypothetical protein
MGERSTAGEFRQLELEAAKKHLAAIELGRFGNSDGGWLEPPSLEEVSRIQSIVAHLTRELAEYAPHRP